MLFNFFTIVRLYVYPALLVLFFFGLTVFIHEFGHYLMARRRRMIVERFFIGFGPRIFSWKRDGIEYGVAWLPFGGYVALPQMGPMEAVEGKTDKTAAELPAARPVDKILVAVAGPFMNLVLAFVIATVLWHIGMPAANRSTVIGWIEPNSHEELAGLRAITAKLLALPADKLPADQRSAWKTFAAKLAPLPVRDTTDGQALAPAGKFADKKNCENPELYAVFPFRLCSFEKANRGLGVNALKHRWDRGFFGWRQDDIVMAYLGLTDETSKGVISRARNHDPDSRFPAFWGPNYDWVPDQDHGGVLMKVTQSMLMQVDGDKIFLFPAWPKDWDVNFKLHAPQQTTIECEMRNGKIAKLEVRPPARTTDIVLPAGLAAVP